MKRPSSVKTGRISGVALLGRRMGLRRLLDIRGHFASNYTRIVLTLSGQIQIEEGKAPAVLRKGLPARLYVDLTPCRPVRRWRKFSLSFRSLFLRRLRVGRFSRRTTRVVFELGEVSRYQVTVLSDPVRVVVDLAEKKLPPRPGQNERLWVKRLEGKRRKSRYGKRRLKRRLTLKKRPFVLRYHGALRLSTPLSIRRVAIDPGHGGKEEGAVGLKTGLQEKVVTLDVAKRVLRWLRKRSRLEFFLTRRADRHLSIARRARMVKRRRADMLISIHVNANRDRKVHGISTYLLNWDGRFYASQLFSTDPLMARENQGVNPRLFRDVNVILSEMQRQTQEVISRVLAVSIQQELMLRVHRDFGSIRDLGVRRGLFYLLFAAGVPGVLVETSFLTNAKEERLLASGLYRQVLAEGIGRGILRFLRLSKDKKHTRKREKKKSIDKRQ
ncbi:MAG: N-acetylmuramoyl-L-alanine amidase [Myxococcota bacterium]